MPWVWSESLEGMLKHSTLIDDLCVGFDGEAVWGGQQKDPPWVLALVAPSDILTKIATEEGQHAALLADMTRVATEKGLQPHEVPLRVRLVPEKFVSARSWIAQAAGGHSLCHPIAVCSLVSCLSGFLTKK